MERVFEAWRVQLGDPDAFRDPGLSLRVRAGGDDQSISVVALLDRVLVTVGRTPPDHLRSAFENHRPPQTLADIDTMTRMVGPIDRTLGPAVLGYVEAENFQPQDGSGLITVDGDDTGLAALSERSGPDEVAESALRSWISPVWVLAKGDLIVAAAGFEVWADTVAHLGVLVEPGHRGQAFGRRVAGAATAAALDAGLAPQWRCRVDLAPSRRIAQVLGFEERGRQAAFWPH